MRNVVRVALIVFGGAVLAVVCGAGWFFFYSRDLPDTNHLHDFALTAQQQAIDTCLVGPVVANPFDQIGKNLRDAVAIIETPPQHGGPPVSVQIARTLFCNSNDKMLTRHLKELRTAIQLDRGFSRQELLTIYLNRVYLGECGTGVENAAQCFFHKGAANLTPAEAALIAGMIGSPSRYSPSRHPDRALEQRNTIIDAMVAAGTLSQTDAQSAKSSRLLD
jgi:membrane peptidoglycan carboxypeptidase